MMEVLMPVALGAGGVLISARSIDRLHRIFGVGLIGAALMVSHNAYADETVMVEDNSRVACVASEKDLTRISLIGDEFASVSKVQPTNPLDDFSVVNERSEEHTSELQSLMRISYAVFCLKKKKQISILITSNPVH